MTLISNQEIGLLTILFVLVTVVLALRRSYYDRKQKAVMRYRDEYRRVLAELFKGSREENDYDRVAEIEIVLVTLFKQAGEYHPSRGIYGSTRRLYGSMGPMQSKVENFFQSCHESVGYFRARKNETLESAFWIETFLNWPRNVAQLLGFDKHGSVANVLKLAVLLLEFVGGILLLLSRLY